MMSFFYRFIRSFDVISCLYASCVQVVGLCGKESNVCALGFVDPMWDHQENILGEFKAHKAKENPVDG